MTNGLAPKDMFDEVSLDQKMSHLYDVSRLILKEVGDMKASMVKRKWTERGILMGLGASGGGIVALLKDFFR